MEKRSVTHSTLVIEREYAVTPEHVFAAFSDPAKKRRWFAENENCKLETHELDFRVGGMERMQSRFKEGTPFPGAALANDTVYQDIVPNSRIVLAYTMSVMDRRISASLATFEFLPTKNGTNLIFTDQIAFFEGGDGAERREHGWRQLLERLAGEFSA